TMECRAGAKACARDLQRAARWLDRRLARESLAAMDRAAVGPLVRGDDGRHARGNGCWRSLVRRRPALRRRRAGSQGPPFRHGGRRTSRIDARANGRCAVSDYEILDSRFRSMVLPNAPLEKLADGFRWLEGPVWFADMQCLLFRDIPNDRIMRWTASGGVSAFRQPSRFANGHTRDREGRLVGCLHGGRAIARTELDGDVTLLADRFEGKRLNSPNDVVVKSDGTIWFSDPPYGIQTDYEGGKHES